MVLTSLLFNKCLQTCYLLLLSFLLDEEEDFSDPEPDDPDDELLPWDTAELRPEEDDAGFVLICVPEEVLTGADGRCTVVLAGLIFPLLPPEFLFCPKFPLLPSGRLFRLFPLLPELLLLRPKFPLFPSGRLLLLLPLLALFPLFLLFPALPLLRL